MSFASEEYLPGVDLILPDIRFLIEERRNIVGLVLTHAHEDHFGALIDLWPQLKVPLYATPFTAALFEAKPAGGARRAANPGQRRAAARPDQLAPFDRRTSSMSRTRSRNRMRSSSAPRLGTVLHTGDWKIDPTPVLGPPTDEAKLTALGDEGVLALIGDSTNAVREGRSPSEADVAKTLAELIRTAPARVAVTTFASHVGRIRAVAEAARLADREVVVVGRAMERVVAGRARDRLSRRRRRISASMRRLRLSAARQGAGALHRQPGRAARRARRASPRTSIRKSRSAAATA